MDMTAREIKSVVGALLARHLLTAQYEYTLPNGRRMDVAAIGQSGRLIGIEVKTTMADFRRDYKWTDYVQFCTLFFFAVPKSFNVEAIPAGPGVIMCDHSQATFVRRNRWSVSKVRPAHYYPRALEMQPGLCDKIPMPKPRIKYFGLHSPKVEPT